MRVTIGVILAATATLTIGAALSEQPLLALAPLVCGAIWLAGLRFRRRWLEALALAGMMLAAAALTFTAMVPLASLVGLTLTLCAWSLTDAERHIAQASVVEDEATLRRSYQRRLLMVAGLGLGLGGIAMLSRFEIGALVALPLGVLAIIGIGRVIRALRRATQLRQDGDQ